MPDGIESVGRRPVLKALAALPFLRPGRAAGAGIEAVWHYLESLVRPDGGYAWPDDPDSTLTTTFAAIACYRLLGLQPPRKSELVKFLGGAYPMPESRRKDRPLHRFDYEQVQGLLWLDVPVDGFRAQAREWVAPSYFTKTYELHENPVLQQETGAILTRRLLGLPTTAEWRTYVLSRRRPNGSFNNTPGDDGSDGHVTNTWWGLLALDALGLPMESKPTLTAWLRSCQIVGGGFTCAPHSALAATDHVDYTWAALKALHMLGAAARDSAAAQAYLVSLWNADGGFGDRPGRASNPLATWQALDALSVLGPVGEISTCRPPLRRNPIRQFPSRLNVYNIQIEAPGIGQPARSSGDGERAQNRSLGSQELRPRLDRTRPTNRTRKSRRR